jgi:molecular chaperone GrpE
VESLRAELEAARARVAAGEDRARELQERQLRVAAEFDNFRKRSARDREEAVRAANERLLRDLLPVVDNLERALAAGGDAAGLQAGVRLVHKQFVDALGRFGVKAFDSVGERFDPARHEALMQQETVAVPEGHVVAEMAKGYLLNDRLVRPASVVVAKAPESAPSSADQDPTPPAQG